MTTTIAAPGQGFELGRFEGHVNAKFDNSVLAFGAEGNGNFQSVTLDLSLETTLDDEAFEAFTAEVGRRCPVTQLFEKSGLVITANWTNKALVSA